MPSTSQLFEPRLAEEAVSHCLMVVRQDPETRQFRVLGDLLVLVSGGYTFTYRDGIVDSPGFRPVPGFPDTTIAYHSSELLTPRR